MRFQIEVRSRSPEVGFAAWIYVEAATEQAALDEARRRFRDPNPDEDVADYGFRVVKS